MTQLNLTASRWRLLNALDGPAGPVNAAALLAGQSAPQDDLHWVAGSGLVKAGVAGGRAGTAVPIDLADHLTHRGAAAAVVLSLTSRGRTAVQTPRNRVLRLLGTAGELPLDRILADAAADVELIAALRLRRLLTAVVRATGEPLGADELPLLPAATVTVRLSDHGRGYLPLRTERLDQVEMRRRVKSRPYVVGLVNGEVLTQGGRGSDPECCARCGAAPHRGRQCRGFGSAGEANEGHRGDEL